METKFKSTISAMCQTFGGAVCAGAVLFLIASNVQAQNLFETDTNGNIYEFTTNGVQSTFASGLSSPLAWPSITMASC